MWKRLIVILNQFNYYYSFSLCCHLKTALSTIKNKKIKKSYNKMKILKSKLQVILMREYYIIMQIIKKKTQT